MHTEKQLKRITCALLSTYLSMSSKFKAVASFAQCDPNFFLENQKPIFFQSLLTHASEFLCMWSDSIYTRINNYINQSLVSSPRLTPCISFYSPQTPSSVQAFVHSRYLTVSDARIQLINIPYTCGLLRQ